MKRLFLAIMVLVSPWVSAQIDRDANTVQIVAYWDEGDHQTYRITQTKARVVDGVETVVQESSSLVDLVVKAVEPKRYLVSWTYHDLKGPDDTEASVVARRLVEGLEVDVAVSDLGTFQGVENWKSLADHMGLAIDALLQNQKSDPKVASMVQNLKAMFSTKQAIEALAVREVLQFYWFHGLQYDIGQEYTGDQEVASPFGTGAVHTQISASVSPDEVYDDSFVVRHWSTVDPQDAKKAILGFLAKTLTGVSPVPQESDLGEFLIEDRTASEIHADSGWLLSSLQVREVRYQGNVQLEKRLIELVE